MCVRACVWLSLGCAAFRPVPDNLELILCLRQKQSPIFLAKATAIETGRPPTHQPAFPSPLRKDKHFKTVFTIHR